MSDIRDIAVSVVRNPDGPRFRRESGAKLLCGPKAPKPYQGECFNQLIDKQHRIIDIPTAAGKSVIMMALATHDAMNGLKPIIVVPQLSIGLGFHSDHFILPSTGDDILWQTYEPNFLIGNTTVSSVQRVIEYLENPAPRDPACAHLVTTHQTLSQVYDQLRKEKRTHLLKRISLFIDECHHVRGDKYTSNKLGEITRHVTKMRSSKVTLVTATNFRTDTLPIAPADIKEANFSKYGLPYDQYIKYKSIGSLGFQFRLFKEEPCVDAGDVVRGFLNKDEKSIIYVPVTNHSFYNIYLYSKDHQEMKAQVVDEILRGICPDADWVEDDHYWTGIVDGKEVRVVDLIDESNRRAKVKHINDNKTCNKNGVDVIIAMSMFKEGSDYPLLQHAIVIEPRGSLGEVIQMFGRVMRDDVQVKKGRKYAKNRVSFTYLLSAPHEDYEQFNRYMNALVQAMLLVDVMEPILVAVGMKKPKKKKQDRDDPPPTVPTLPDLFGDPEIAGRVYNDIIEEIAMNEEWGEISSAERKNKMVEIVQEQIDIHNVVIPEGIVVEDIANKTYAMLVRDCLPKGIRHDVIIDPELIYKHAPLSYLSKVMGRDFFQRYREEVTEYYGDREAIALQNVREVAEYKQKHGHYPPANRKGGRLGQWLNRIRRARNGTNLPYGWYPFCEKLATELGCSDMFHSLEERALSKTHEVAKYKKKHDVYPPANNKGARLGRWLAAMRTAKRDIGKSNNTWYPECEVLAKELGCPDMFDSHTQRDLALSRTREVVEYKKKHGRYPSTSSRSDSLGFWLGNARRARNKTGKSVWYPECESLAIELGCPDLFEKANAREIRLPIVLDKTRQVVKYKKKHKIYPPANAKGGKLGGWLSDMRALRAGVKKRGTWYPECEALAKELGCPDMFELPNTLEKRIQKALERTREVAEYKKKHDVYPSTSGQDRLGIWLNLARQAKAGMSGKPWYTECDKLAKKLGCSDMFVRAADKEKKR